MSYTITVNGDADSKKGEAEAVLGLVRFLEATGAAGAVTFVGEHFSISSSAGEDAIVDISKALNDYNASAERHDKAGV